MDYDVDVEDGFGHEGGDGCASYMLDGYYGHVIEDGEELVFDFVEFQGP